MTETASFLTLRYTLCWLFTRPMKSQGMTRPCENSQIAWVQQACPFFQCATGATSQLATRDRRSRKAAAALRQAAAIVAGYALFLPSRLLLLLPNAVGHRLSFDRFKPGG